MTVLTVVINNFYKRKYIFIMLHSSNHRTGFELCRDRLPVKSDAAESSIYMEQLPIWPSQPLGWWILGYMMSLWRLVLRFLGFWRPDCQRSANDSRDRRLNVLSKARRAFMCKDGHPSTDQWRQPDPSTRRAVIKNLVTKYVDRDINKTCQCVWNLIITNINSKYQWYGGKPYFYFIHLQCRYKTEIRW